MPLTRASLFPISDIGKSDARVKGIKLSRNFGQHHALTAGIDIVRANWYVIMDCDLQDAPEDIPCLYTKALEGHHVVAGIRDKEGHDVLKRHGSRIFYFLFKALSGVRLDWSTGNFRIFSDQVAEGFRQVREQLRFIPASFEWMGFNPVYIRLAHHQRREGRSSYSLGKLLKLATNTIIAYTQVPLKLVAWAGIVMSLIAFALAVVFFARTLLYGTSVAGWSSLMVTVLLMGSIQIALIGILGIYIGKTFEEAKRRPLYIVNGTLNLETGSPDVVKAKSLETSLCVVEQGLQRTEKHKYPIIDSASADLEASHSFLDFSPRNSPEPDHSYSQADDQSDGLHKLVKLSRAHGIRF